MTHVITIIDITKVCREKLVRFYVLACQALIFSKHKNFLFTLYGSIVGNSIQRYSRFFSIRHLWIALVSVCAYVRDSYCAFIFKRLIAFIR